MSSIGSAGSSSSQIEAQASVLVAAQGLSQAKQDGANAVALIESAAPATGDHRGQRVNTVA